MQSPAASTGEVREDDSQSESMAVYLLQRVFLQGSLLGSSVLPLQLGTHLGMLLPCHYQLCAEDSLSLQTTLLGCCVYHACSYDSILTMRCVCRMSEFSSLKCAL